MAGIGDFLFGKGALDKAAGKQAPAPAPEPVDTAALAKRNQEFTDQQKAAADKARSKSITAPKTNPAKSAAGRKRY